MVTKTMMDIDEVSKVNVLTDRVKKRKEELLAAKEHICAERSRLVTESWKETEGYLIMGRRAKLFQKVMEGNPVVIRDGELIVGSQTKYVRGASPPVDWSTKQVNGLLAELKPKMRGLVVEAEITEEEKRSLAEDAEYWEGRSPGDVKRKLVQDAVGEKANLDDWEEARGITWNFELPPVARSVDYGKVIDQGLNGVIREIRQELENLDISLPHTLQEQQFLKAGLLCCEAVITFANRYAKLARELAEKESDVVRKRELEKTAEICEWVPANPARTFHEAVQSFWFIQLVINLECASDGETPGRLDQYLYPLYEKDITEGRITRQEAGELLGCLWVKFSEMMAAKALAHKRMHQASHFQDTVLCGVTKDGKDATNELSFLILEVIRQTKLPQPPVYLRYHKNINEEVLVKAAEANRDYGAGNPSFVNDSVTLLKLTSRGVPLTDARDWAIQGCISPMIPHASQVKGGLMAYTVKPFELALHNGKDPQTGKQLGPATGDARNFKSYDELYDAFLKQLEHQIEVVNITYPPETTVGHELYEMPFNSVLIDDCIKKRKSINQGGLRYPQISPTWTDRGYQNVGDSLAAIKKLVFEEKKISMAEVMDAIDANFEGKEELRQMLMAAPCYGNDDDYVDDIWGRVVLDATRMQYENTDIHGYPYFVARHGASGHYYVGMGIGALPDGKKAGEPVGDGAISPVQGKDVKGPTAVILSATKINHEEYAMSALMNMKIMPSALRTKEGIRNFLALIKTFFDRGGWHVQFNVIGQEILLEAKKHPEKYRDLLVRVAGYSAYFVELSPQVQDEIISRTEHGL